MKLTLQSYGKTYTAEDKFDDLDIYQVVGLFRGLLLSAGFSPTNVEEVLGESCEAEIGPIP